MTPLFPLRRYARLAAVAGASLLFASGAFAKIGDRFPSEKKVVIDPVTGTPLTFLTSQPKGDSKIYQTHHQWTSDGKWVIFRSNRVRGQAMAVNEETGDIVQVTENGYSGMLCLADRSMSLYFARLPGFLINDVTGASSVPTLTAADGDKKGPAVNAPRGPAQIVKVDLGKLFADSAAGKVGKAEEYEHVCGTVPVEYGAIGDVALDPNEDFVYFGVKSKEEAAKYLDAATKPAETFGPRKMGSGPNGLASMNLITGEVKYIVSVPFQVGHVQTNPWMPGEIIFCWETGGKAPQRTWTVRSDGSGLRPVYAEAPYEWITHEAVITKDEVAFAIMGHRKPGTGVDKPDDWGISGTREHPTGLGIVNLRTREMRIAGQTKSGSGLWHVNGSGDGRWAVGDDFSRSVYLIDRHTDEMVMLTTGHKPTAADHPHPTFNSDGTKIEIESAMLSEDGKTMNICIVPVPQSWLKRTYGSTKVQ